MNNIFPEGDGLPGNTLLGDDRGNTAECTTEIRRNGGLHAHLDRLEWAEGDVGDQLGGSTGDKVKRGLPFGGTLLSDEIAVELLEVLVSAILECSLGLSWDFVSDSVKKLVFEWFNSHCSQRKWDSSR